MFTNEDMVDSFQEIEFQIFSVGFMFTLSMEAGVLLKRTWNPSLESVSYQIISPDMVTYSSRSHRVSQFEVLNLGYEHVIVIIFVRSRLRENSITIVDFSKTKRKYSAHISMQWFNIPSQQTLTNFLK